MCVCVLVLPIEHRFYVAVLVLFIEHIFYVTVLVLLSEYRFYVAMLVLPIEHRFMAISPESEVGPCFNDFIYFIYNPNRQDCEG